MGASWQTRRPSFRSRTPRRRTIRHNGAVHAAAITFDLHIPQSRSLKAKRAVIRPIVDGLRHRFRLSVAEVDHQDQWQRAAIGVAVIAESDGRVQELLDAVDRYVTEHPTSKCSARDRLVESRRTRDRRRSRRASTRASRASTRWCAKRSPSRSNVCRDPRLGIVTLTGVEVSPDLRYATVYYSSLVVLSVEVGGPGADHQRRHPVRHA